MAITNILISFFEIKRESPLIVLGVMIDENLTRRTHVEFFESKISKRVEIIIKTGSLLNSKCLLSTYFALVHSYIN